MKVNIKTFRYEIGQLVSVYRNNMRQFALIVRHDYMDPDNHSYDGYEILLQVSEEYCIAYDYEFIIGDNKTHG